MAVMEEGFREKKSPNDMPMKTRKFKIEVLGDAS
jgi:hypothetical protein